MSFYFIKEEVRIHFPDDIKTVIMNYCKEMPLDKTIKLKDCICMEINLFDSYMYGKKKWAFKYICEENRVNSLLIDTFDYWGIEML